MYRLFVFFGGLIVIALFAALIAPFFIDWTVYRTRLEQEASAVLGQPVRVAGQVNVRILPLPRVTFTDLTVGRNEDGSPMMTAKSFSVLAELMPLLSGEVRIVDMELVEPHVAVQVSPSGVISWTARQQYALAPEKIRLENLVVRNASINIVGLAGGRVLSGNGINAIITAQSLLGPWRIEAAGEFEGKASEIDIATGRLQESGAIRLKMAARPSGLPYHLVADGPVRLQDGVLEWAGAFEILPANESPGGIAALPVRVSGKFAATPHSVDVPEYRLDVGRNDDPYSITGNGGAVIREDVRFRLEADGRQIDLDRLGARGSQGGEKAGASLAERLNGLKDILDRVPIPAGKGSIDFKLPAIVAGDTVIREIDVVAEPDGNRWRIASLKAIFPGNTQVEARGVFGVGKNFGFSGRMLLASRQPTGFAAWLSGNSNAALRGLGAAGFSADVAFNAHQANFENLELVLGSAVLKGKMQRLSPDGGRPAIVASLTGDRINLDDLVAIYSLAESRDGAGFTNHDLDIDLTAQSFEGLGMTARGIDASFRVEGGSLTVNRLKADDFYGAAIDSSGRLADMLTKPNGSFRLNLKAGDGAALAGLALKQLGSNPALERYAADPDLSENLELAVEVDARAQGDGSRGVAIVSGSAGGTAISLRDRFDGRMADWRNTLHDLSVRLEQQNPALLARQLTLPVLPLDAPGPVALSAEISGNAAKGLGVQFSANVPGADLSATGTIALAKSDNGWPEAKLDITLGAQDMDPWLFMSGYPLPGTGDGNPVSLALKFTSANGPGLQLGFDAIAGNYSGNGFSGELALGQGESRPKIGGKMHFDRFSGPFAGELVTGAGTLGLDGLVVATDLEFGKPLLAGLDAEIMLTAGAFDAGGGPEGNRLSAKFALSDGAVSLSSINGGWFGGTFGGDITVQNEAGKAAANGRLTLANSDAAALAAAAGLPGLVSGSADISVNLDGGGLDFGSIVSSLSGSGVLALRDGVLNGVSTDGMSAVLDAGDNENFEIDTGNVEALARRIFLKGEAPFRQANDAFSISQGKISLRNLLIETGTGRITGNAEYDLVNGQAGANIDVGLDAGRQAIAGGEPAASFAITGEPGAFAVLADVSALEGYLSLRAFEREQRRVDLLQESVIERQRLSGEIRMAKARATERAALRTEQLRNDGKLQHQDKSLPHPDASQINGAKQETGSVRKAESGDRALTAGDAAEQSIDLFKEIERRLLKH